MLGIAKIISPCSSHGGSNGSNSNGKAPEQSTASTRRTPRRGKSSDGCVAAPQPKANRLASLLDVRSNHERSTMPAKQAPEDETKILADFLRSAERLEAFAKEKAEKEARRARRRKNGPRRSKSNISSSGGSTLYSTSAGSSCTSSTFKQQQQQQPVPVPVPERPKLRRRRSFMGLGRRLKEEYDHQPKVIELQPLEPFELPEKKKKKKPQKKEPEPDHSFFDDDDDDEDELIIDLDEDLESVSRQIQNDVKNMVIVINRSENSAVAA